MSFAVPLFYLSQLISWCYHFTCQYWSGFYKVHTYHPHHTVCVSNNPSTHQAPGIIWSNHKYCCRAQCNRPSNLNSSSNLIFPFDWIKYSHTSFCLDSIYNIHFQALQPGCQSVEAVATAGPTNTGKTVNDVFFLIILPWQHV